MAPAMSIPIAIAGEHATSSGEAFTFDFGWTKPTAEPRVDRVVDARQRERESQRPTADGPGWPA